MAKITPSALITGMQGSVGSVTFRHGRGFIAAGARQTFQHPPTDFQRGARRANAYLKQGWSQLSTADQNSWNQLGLQLLRQSVGDGKYPRRGYDLFLEYNWTRSVFFEALTEVAPTDYQKTTMAPPTTFRGQLSTVPTARWQNFILIPNSDYRGFAWCRMGMRGAQKSAFCPWKYITFLNASGMNVDIVAAYNLVFPTPQLGQIYQWKYLAQSGTAFPMHFQDEVRTVVV